MTGAHARARWRGARCHLPPSPRDKTISRGRETHREGRGDDTIAELLAGGGALVLAVHLALVAVVEIERFICVLGIVILHLRARGQRG